MQNRPMTLTRKQRMGKFYIATVVGLLVVCLLILKYIIHTLNLDFITLNPLIGTVVSSVTFVIGFLLSGVFMDYKEVDKIPAEIRGALESILGEAEAFARKDSSFNTMELTSIMSTFIEEFEDGLSDTKNHSHMGCALAAIKKLDTVFDQMDERGIPPNYLTRIKQDQAHLRRLVLRVYHIQKTQFVPSITILVQILVLSMTTLLLFVEIDIYTGFIQFGLLSFLLLYTMRLIHVLEKPFRKGKDNTIDDVSIFLLREFNHEIKNS